jgi:NDP-sugar pyrophosphorylase family protein
MLTQWNAIVLCAGLGTRLRPLTQVVPKTVIPIGKWPLAFHAIFQLLEAGIETVHCNTHYLADVVEKQLSEALQNAGYGRHRIRFWREESLLNTGGGIANIVQTLKLEGKLVGVGNTLIVSGDILGPIPISEMVDTWARKEPNCVGLMVTRELNEERKDATWATNDGKHIVGFGENKWQLQRPQKRLFTTYQMLAGNVLLREPLNAISSIDLYYRAALSRGEIVQNLDLPNHCDWADVGTYVDYAIALNLTKKDKARSYQNALVAALNTPKTEASRKAPSPTTRTPYATPLSLLPFTLSDVPLLQGNVEDALEPLFGQRLKGLLATLSTEIPALQFQANPRRLPKPSWGGWAVLMQDDQSCLLSPFPWQDQSLCLGAYSRTQIPAPLLLPLEALLNHLTSDTHTDPTTQTETETESFETLLQYNQTQRDTRTYLLLIPEPLRQ